MLSWFFDDETGLEGKKTFTQSHTVPQQYQDLILGWTTASLLFLPTLLWRRKHAEGREEVGGVKGKSERLIRT